jgi:SAM-dependent methyltransferase
MTRETELPEHVLENRRYWDGRAHEWVRAGERLWRSEEPVWGVWQVPDSELQLLPRDMTRLSAVELGCGTGYVSGWMERRGARVAGIDNSEGQLRTARRLAAEQGADITFVHGNAEATPFEAGSFDFAISEYGAAIWCDPALWLPEAFRILKPGGSLVFMGTHPLAITCTPPDGSATGDRLARSYFELDRADWTQVDIDPGGIEFNRPLSGWFKLFRATGFEVVDVLEPRPAQRSDQERFGLSGGWAADYPSEQVWKRRKPG